MRFRAKPMSRLAFLFAFLPSPATVAHIHCRAAIGATAPVVIPFTGFPSAISGTYANTFVGISQANVDDIKAGLTYITIHDATFPAGEIRAQSAPKHPSWAMMISALGLANGLMRDARC